MGRVLVGRRAVWLRVAVVVGAMAGLARPALAQSLEPLNIAVGDFFPDFSALDQNNQPFTLSTHQGQVAVLHICAMWCVPCRNSAGVEQAITDTLNATIGSPNWLLVDALVESTTGGPTNQSLAIAWRKQLKTPAL